MIEKRKQCLGYQASQLTAITQKRQFRINSSDRLWNSVLQEMTPETVRQGWVFQEIKIAKTCSPRKIFNSQETKRLLGKP